MLCEGTTCSNSTKTLNGQKGNLMNIILAEVESQYLKKKTVWTLSSPTWYSFGDMQEVSVLRQQWNIGARFNLLLNLNITVVSKSTVGVQHPNLELKYDQVKKCQFL